MDAFDATGRRFHPERTLLLGALALLLAVFLGFVLGVMATAEQPAVHPDAARSALPTTSPGDTAPLPLLLREQDRLAPNA